MHVIFGLCGLMFFYDLYLAAGVRHSLGDLGLPQRYSVERLKEMDM